MRGLQKRSFGVTVARRIPRISIHIGVVILARSSTMGAILVGSLVAVKKSGSATRRETVVGFTIILRMLIFFLSHEMMPTARLQERRFKVTEKTVEKTIASGCPGSTASRSGTPKNQARERNDLADKAALTRRRGVAQLVARLVRDQEVVGSDPVTPTKNTIYCS